MENGRQMNESIKRQITHFQDIKLMLSDIGWFALLLER